MLPIRLGGCIMIHSMHFGRAFWLDEEDQLCSCPWRKDGTVEKDNWDYVSEWTDWEGVNMEFLLQLHSRLHHTKYDVFGVSRYGVQS